MDYTGIIIKFLGSLGLFLFGMTVLSSSLQKTAGSKMKHLLGKMSKNRFRGVLFGAGVTSIMQSSTATTVMAVGFVNAGIISLTQIVGIMMGANIGSTTTSWLVSSVEWVSFLKPEALGALSAATGALMLLFSKKGKTKNIGEVIVGFGVLFIGLSQMPDAVKPLAESDVVRSLFVTLGGNPILALLIGILVTGVIQSSAASIGILQSMAVTGVIPWNAAVFIVLGQNVGTCFTTMLTSIGANKNTRAASLVHFVYNAVGAVLFSVGGFIFFTFVNPSMGGDMVSSTDISMFHTGYNVLLLLLLFPFGSVILRIATKIAGKEKPKNDGSNIFEELNEHILEIPEYALENSVKAFNKLIEMIRANIDFAATLFINRRFDEIDTFNSRVAEIDKCNSTVKTFLTRLYNEKINESENVQIATLLHNLTRLGRISNHSKGIIKQLKVLRDNHFEYSEKITEMLRNLSKKTMNCYDEAVITLNQINTEFASIALQISGEVKSIYEDYKAGHLERISSGEYSIQNDIILLEVMRHFTRMAHNSRSIAETVEISAAEDGDLG